ncbi:hypothetical protein BH20VER3_BH20VER3_06220 [soil metagenome]
MAYEVVRVKPPAAGRNLAAANRDFYDALWSRAYLQRPERFNTWPFIERLLPSCPERLEVGPGLRPRLPIARTHFIDLSPPAIESLNARGGRATLAELGVLPFAEQALDLVCACDVVEHVAEDRQLLGEFSRVLKDGGTLILSVPLHPELWNEFDDWVGHARRYDPSKLQDLLRAKRFTVEQSAPYGMKPRCHRLIKFGMSWLQNRRREAMFWYNWLALPLTMWLQKDLQFVKGLAAPGDADELLLICRRLPRSE